MKKALSLIIALMLLAAPLALAEEAAPVTIEITFDGSYLPFEDLGFQLMLPNEWNILETEDYYAAFANDDLTQGLVLAILEVEEGDTLESLADAMMAEIEGVVASVVTINGIPFVVYDAMADDITGAFTLTDNGQYCVHFIFYPGSDEAFTELAVQIMASIQAL